MRHKKKQSEYNNLATHSISRADKGIQSYSAKSLKKFQSIVFQAWFPCLFLYVQDDHTMRVGNFSWVFMCTCRSMQITACGSHWLEWTLAPRRTAQVNGRFIPLIVFVAWYFCQNQFHLLAHYKKIKLFITVFNTK